MKNLRSTDSVCDEYADKGAKVTIRELDGSTVLIEGDSAGLRFLGELLLAHADASGDDGFQISPNGAGRLFFGKEATFGIYLHRLPCTERDR